MAYSDKEIQEAKETIIEEISNGRSLNSILKGDKNLPSRNRVYEWLNPNEDKYDKKFCDNYTRAREDSADLDAERVDEIAEATLAGVYDPAVARVVIDAKKWTAGKKKPKKYGDSSLLKLGDNEGNKLEMDRYSDEELLKKFNELSKES